jgi:hypothetical protein
MADAVQILSSVLALYGYTVPPVVLRFALARAGAAISVAPATLVAGHLDAHQKLSQKASG